MPFGFPKKPGRPTVKGAAESAVKKTAVAFILSPVGLTIIGVAFALAFMLIMITSIVAKASTDPIFAAQVGLDAFFGNTPQTTIAPPPPPPGGGTPPAGSGNQQIVTWAKTITDSLTRKIYVIPPNSQRCTWDVQNNPRICNGPKNCAKVVTTQEADCLGFSPAYLCTQLVIDSYNLSGLSIDRNWTYEPTMRSKWAQKSGYQVLNDTGKGAISQLRAGDVIFMEAFGGSDHHVVVVQDTNIDSNGSGTIDILQANSLVSGKSDSYTIRNWHIINSYNLDPNTQFWYGLGPRS